MNRVTVITPRKNCGRLLFGPLEPSTRRKSSRAISRLCCLKRIHGVRYGLYAAPNFAQFMHRSCKLLDAVDAMYVVANRQFSPLDVNQVSCSQHMYPWSNGAIQRIFNTLFCRDFLGDSRGSCASGASVPSKRSTFRLRSFAFDFNLMLRDVLKLPRTATSRFVPISESRAHKSRF